MQCEPRRRNARRSAGCGVAKGRGTVDDLACGDRAGEDIRVRGAAQPELLDVHRVETMRRAEMTGEQRRQVLVDQETRRHNLPPGRPRGGFAFAWRAAASTASRSR